MAEFIATALMGPRGAVKPDPEMPFLCWVSVVDGASSVCCVRVFRPGQAGISTLSHINIPLTECLLYRLLPW
jgi:hypothetical protein